VKKQLTRSVSEVEMYPGATELILMLSFAHSMPSSLLIGSRKLAKHHQKLVIVQDVLNKLIFNTCSINISTTKKEVKRNIFSLYPPGGAILY
jgi:hypothetical protein